MTAEVTVTLIDDFRVELDGRTVERRHFERAAAAELVQLLALSERRRLPRDQVIDALWPDAAPSTASNNLSKASSYARRALGDKSAIVVGGGVVALFPGVEVDVDVHRVLTVDPGDGEAVDRVLAADVGELLPDIPYAEWTIEARARLRLRLLDLLRARDRWLDVLRLDPADEEANVALMTAAIEDGDREGVLRRFEELERVLADELGVVPSQAAVEVRDRALAIDARLAERALRRLERPRHNLPAPVSSFVGRLDELGEIERLLGQARLVTLTGIGGVGKTRLAIEVARRLAGDGRADGHDGVWLVEVAPLDDGGQLADAVAAALALPGDGPTPSRDQVVGELVDRRALLVVDNAEHLLDPVAELVDHLLRSCPELRILATSRSALGVAGEARRLVQPLGVEADGSAVELFADRARLVRPDVAVTEANRETVARLCRRLDGIPLAIELATARLNVLSVEAIDANLDDRFRFLTGGSRTAAERQRTLQAMMDWSNDLLSPPDQVLLRRLGVFADGFDLDAAKAVAAGDGQSDFDVLDGLNRLVDASLLSVGDGDTGGDTRYRLLETVRRFGLDRLVAAGETDGVRDRHLAHYTARARALTDRLRSAEPAPVDGGRRDLANYRVALSRAAESGAGQRLLDLAVPLRLVFWGLGLGRASLHWLTLGLRTLGTGAASPLSDRALAYAIVDAHNMADAERSAELLPAAERRIDEVDDPSSRGLLANAIAVELTLDDLAASDRLLVDATGALREAGDPMWRAAVTNRMLPAWWMSSPAVFAEILATDGLGDERGLATVTMPIIRLAAAVVSDDPGSILASIDGIEATSVWEESVLIYCRAHALRATGRSADVLILAEGIDRAGGVTLHQFLMRQQFALAAVDVGDIERAGEEFVPFRTDTRVGRALATRMGALLAQRRGDDESAARLAGFAGRVGREVGYRPHPLDATMLDRSVRAIGERLGRTVLDGLLADGAAADWADLTVPGVDDRGDLR